MRCENCKCVAERMTACGREQAACIWQTMPEALWCAHCCCPMSSPDSEDLNCVCASPAPPLLVPSLLETLDCSDGLRASGLVSEDSRSRAVVLRSAGPPSNLPVCVCGQEVGRVHGAAGERKVCVRRGDEKRWGNARVRQGQGGVGRWAVLEGGAVCMCLLIRERWGGQPAGPAGRGPCRMGPLACCGH